jgi:hypothetical protein
MIDKHGQVGEAVMTGKDERLPRRPFLPFPVRVRQTTRASLRLNFSPSAVPAASDKPCQLPVAKTMSSIP